VKRIAIITLIFGAVLVVGWKQSATHKAVCSSTEELKRQLDDTAGQAGAALRNLAALRKQFESAGAALDSARAQVARLARDMAAPVTHPQWTQPPESLPGWNQESPFVWIDKEMLPRFPVTPFSDAGTLLPGIASVLAIEPERVNELNQSLSLLLSEFRTQEAAHAHPSDEHLPGIANADGDKLTLVVDPIPEVSERLRAQFETTLHEQLGPQRADLLLRTGRGWMQDQFGWSDPDSEPPPPRTFSVVRHPDGSYNISIKSGNGWMSVGGPNSFRDLIPEHLRHLFAELEQPVTSP